MMGSVPKDYLFLRLFMPLRGSFAQPHEHTTALVSTTMSTQKGGFVAGTLDGVPLAREKPLSSNWFGALAVKA